MTVLYDVDEAVAMITLNRPDAMNSLTTPMRADLLTAVERAQGDASVRAVVLTGAGRAFCAGQDLREHADKLERGIGLDDTVRMHYNPIVRAITSMGKPVVAAVNGVAAGAGASLAFACDFRVASEKAKFVMAFTGIGLAPDSGASWTLQRLVGLARARELLLLGEAVDARRALELGLVSRIVPDEEVLTVALDLAVRLAHGPTLAYAATKKALNFAATHSLSDSLDLEAAVQDECAATADHVSATKAFVNKEQPVFEGQ